MKERLDNVLRYSALGYLSIMIINMLWMILFPPRLDSSFAHLINEMLFFDELWDFYHLDGLPAKSILLVIFLFTARNLAFGKTYQK